MSRFQQATWLYLAYLIGVILLGAWVRISGSGAGCGSHWPLCNGEVIPVAPSIKTLTEFTHRLTSGLCGLFAIGLVFWARRINRWVFRAALASLFFVLMEGFIGAVLVKKELVVNDTSASRAIVIALHLANTLLLTASTAAMALWASRPQEPAPASRLWLALALLALILTNSTGAITALGDTLFPRQPALSGDLFAEVTADLSPTQHFLVRLRVMHPMVAVTAASLVGYLLFTLAGTPWVIAGRWTLALQVVLGFLNIALSAPAWMQIVHLLNAQILWICLAALYVEQWRPTSQPEWQAQRLAQGA
jgi:heme a synthase